MLGPLLTSLQSLLGRSQGAAAPWKTRMLAQGAMGGMVAGTDRRGRGLVVWDNGGELWNSALESGRCSALACFPLFPGHDPALALEPSGRGMLVWQGGPGQEGAQAAVVEADRVSPTFHSLDAAGPIRHLQVAVDRRGGAMVLWSQCGARGWETRAQGYDGRTGAWEASSTRLGSPEAQPVTPRLIMNPQGLAMAIWPSRSEDTEGLAVAYHWPHDRIWSDRPIRIATCHAEEVTGTMDRRGSAIACWVNRRHGHTPVIESSCFSEATCEWSEPRVLAKAPGLFHLRLSMDPEGDALLTWRQQESAGKDHLMGRICRNGTWEEASLPISPGGESIRDYAILKSIDQACLLRLPLNGAPELHLMREGRWHPPARLEAEGAGEPSTPTLLTHAAGVTAFWLSGDPGERRLVIATQA